MIDPTVVYTTSADEDTRHWVTISLGKGQGGACHVAKVPVNQKVNPILAVRDALGEAMSQFVSAMADDLRPWREPPWPLPVQREVD